MTSPKDLVSFLLPSYINRMYVRVLFYSLFYRIHNRWLVIKKKKKDKLSVAFIVMSHTMWKEGKLYDLLENSERFTPILVLAPTPRIYNTPELYNEETLRMSSFFRKMRCRYIMYDDFENGKYEFDIAFYQQPYEDGILPRLHPLKLRNTLVCYIPYSFPTLYLKYDYLHLIMNIAWKMFYPSNAYKDMIKELSICGGHNVVASGYLSADYLINPDIEKAHNFWTESIHSKKRIIWAPHHSVSNRNLNIHQSTFLEYHEVMLNIADCFSEEIEIAFNPHPLLFDSLKHHLGWSDDNIRNYVKEWEKRDNCVVTYDNYIDVFNTSDALIHDCASFTVEYIYTLKPVLFLCKNSVDTDHRDRLCEPALKAFDAHYKAYQEADVFSFIKEVVIQGTDTKKADRDNAFKGIAPPYGKNSSENIADYLNKNLSYHEK